MKQITKDDAYELYTGELPARSRTAVLGVPTSGKTKFVNKLPIRKHYDFKSLDLLPNYFKNRTGLALGPVSDYRSVLMFTMEVLDKEVVTRHGALDERGKGKSYAVTNGPLMTYSLFAYKATELSKANEEEKALHYLLLANTVGKIAQDSFWYDAVFYLPYKGEDEELIGWDKSLKVSFRELGLESKVYEIG